MSHQGMETLNKLHLWNAAISWSIHHIEKDPQLTVVHHKSHVLQNHIGKGVIGKTWAVTPQKMLDVQRGGVSFSSVKLRRNWRFLVDSNPRGYMVLDSWVDCIHSTKTLCRRRNQHFPVPVYTETDPKNVVYIYIYVYKCKYKYISLKYILYI